MKTPTDLNINTYMANQQEVRYPGFQSIDIYSSTNEKSKF